jgi:hypothetical protein
VHLLGYGTKQQKMQGTGIEIIEVQQAKIYNTYKNTRLKLLKMNAAIWFNKIFYNIEIATYII